MLKGQGQLTSLVLANNPIGKIEVGAFTDVQNVSSVNMDNSLGDLSPEVLKELLSLPNLQRLSLRNSRISVSLKVNDLQNITNDLPVQLWLEGSAHYFGKQDRRLSTILDVFFNVTGLSVRGNGLRDLDLLSNTENVESLDASNNDIRSGGLTYLFSRLSNVRYLDLANNKIDFVSFLEELPHLECLNITGNRMVYVEYKVFFSFFEISHFGRSARRFAGSISRPAQTSNAS
jgi:Leucine-rich repeat (LRR) protein